MIRLFLGLKIIQYLKNEFSLAQDIEIALQLFIHVQVVLELEFFAIQLPVQVGTSTDVNFSAGQVCYLVNSHGPKRLLI